MKKKISTFWLLMCCYWVGFAQDKPMYLGQECIGLASYYHLPGQQTASGEIMQKHGFTCAHRWYPFGTMLEVINLANNKYVVVRVADRGPFIKGRMIDLSLSAAKALGMLDKGVCRIKMMVVGEKEQVLINRINNTPTENSILEAVSSNNESIPKPVDLLKKQQQRKKMMKKRAKRRKSKVVL